MLLGSSADALVRDDERALRDADGGVRATREGISKLYAPRSRTSVRMQLPYSEST